MVKKLETGEIGIHGLRTLFGNRDNMNARAKNNNPPVEVSGVRQIGSEDRPTLEVDNKAIITEAQTNMPENLKKEFEYWVNHTSYRWSYSIKLPSEELVRYCEKNGLLKLIGVYKVRKV